MLKKIKASNTQTMLRAIINGQSAMKEELLGEIKKLDTKMGEGFKNVNDRLDKIGAAVAYLEDDAPTRKEHSNLEKRVKKIEKKLAFT